MDYFETDLEIPEIASTAVRAVFIRAPWVEQVGSTVEVLSSVTDKKGVAHPVAVRQGSLLATSFHPELTSDNRIHRYFLEQMCHSFQK